MKNKYIILLILSVYFSASCKKDHAPIAGYSLVDSTQAYLKIVDASPNFNRVLGYKDSFNVFVNGVKITAPILSYTGSLPGSNFIYPSGSLGSSNLPGLYASVPAGASAIKLSFPGLVNVDSVGIVTLNKYLAAGQYYTLFITDSIKSNKESSQIFLQDAVPARTPTGFMNLRFLHGVVNDTAGKTVDILSYSSNSTLFSNVSPGMATPFATIPFMQLGVDTFYVTRSAASTVPLSQRLILAKIPFGNSPGNTNNSSFDQRSFTLYYRGDGNLSSGSKARSLGVYVNR